MSDSASAVWVLVGQGGWRAVTGLAADAGGVGKKPGGEPVPAEPFSARAASVRSRI